jgi:hypothetical protein
MFMNLPETIENADHQISVINCYVCTNIMYIKASWYIEMKAGRPQLQLFKYVKHLRDGNLYPRLIKGHLK